MKRYLILALAASFVCRDAAAQNPIIDQGLADPSVKVFGGRAYIYGTHDFAPNNSAWIAKDWHVFSSGDLVTWVDAGVALDDDALSWRVVSDRDWAPDAIAFDDRYYFYFSRGDDISLANDAIGVAAGTSPVGPFTDILGQALVDRSLAPTRNIDPMAFQDTDGSRYLLWGNGGLTIAQLNDDMKSFRTPPQEVAIVGAPSYEEGPFAWIHGGKYYLLYSRCGARCADSLDYAVGDSIRGPYTYRGTVVAHGKQGNEHGSVFEFNGQWYVAYHDLSPTTYYRKTKLEFIHYTNGGDIPRVYPTDYGVGRYDGRKPIEAENYFDRSPGIVYEDCSDRENGFDVTGIDDGSWLKFQKVDFGAGVDSFSARVAAGARPSRIEIRIGSAAGALIGTCDVPAGDQTWQTITTAFGETISGVNDVVLVFKGAERDILKLNWFQFTGPGTPRDPREGGAGGCACTLDAAPPPVDAIVWFLAMVLMANRWRRRLRSRASRESG
jgi:hypothetical protein